MQPCLIGSHNDRIVNSVDRSRFIFDWTTNDDSMWQHRSTDVVLYVPHDNTNHTKKELRAWLDHMEYNYDIFT